ncbi:hypothetical protein JTB14_038206 [Gonioctena quinquepunctata]|nr:hypothetical protein JTB14_038206 [Gonioctena quinquepunctata]
MLYTVPLLIICVGCCILAGIKSFSSEMVMYRLISPLFYFNVSGVIVISMKIARAWPKFMSKVFSEETNFIRKYNMKTNLKAKINITVLVATIAVTVEHVLSTVNFIFSNECGNDAEGFEKYARKHFHFVFGYFTYNTFLAVILVIMSWIATYIWNFGDLLIVVMSILLTSRFEQMKEKITWYVKSTNQYTHRKISIIGPDEKEKKQTLFWKNIREDFDELCQICSRTDRLLADMILFSYSCNLTFILIQLFISLRERDKVVETVYFIFSFGFVITRTVMISIYGGWLSESSKAALPTLNAVPTEMYNPEIARLINQMHTRSPSLTGHNFFSIHKGLVLSVAATIITYELVLIQFNQNTLERYLSQPNITICY